MGPGFRRDSGPFTVSCPAGRQRRWRTTKMMVEACECHTALSLCRTERIADRACRVMNFGGSRRSVVLPCSADFVSLFGRFKSLFACLGNLLPQLTKFQWLAGPV